MARFEGSFSDSDGNELNFSVEKWKEAEGGFKEEIDESDLMRMDFMILEIENPETGESQFQTLNGPIEDWEQVEDFLEYAWGGEGSRAFT